VRLSPRYTPAPTDASCVGRRRCVATPWACEPPPTHAGFRTSCSACAEKWVTGRNTRAKASRALLTMSRVPSSWCPGHPGRRFGSSSGLDDPALLRPGLDPPWMRPREGPHRRKDRGAFCCDGTLTRAGDCSLVRAWTAAPSRRLVRGFAREHARLSYRPYRRPLLTRTAPGVRLDSLEQGGSKPLWTYEPQRPSRLLRPNPLAARLPSGISRSLGIKASA
jgi:hypothetical protein